MQLTPVETTPLGQDNMLLLTYLKIASYHIKCLYLNFTYVQTPKETCPVDTAMPSAPQLEEDPASGSSRGAAG